MLRLFKIKKPAAIFGIAAGSFESLCLIQLVSTSFSRIANPLFLKKKKRYVKAK